MGGSKKQSSSLNQSQQSNQQSSTHKQKKQRKVQDHHNIFPAALHQDSMSFNTRSFMIRYQEEEVELNDMGHFRVELDLSDDSLATMEYCLEIELMFADLVT
jgi:hypothetical protein